MSGNADNIEQEIAGLDFGGVAFDWSIIPNVVHRWPLLANFNDVVGSYNFSPTIGDPEIVSGPPACASFDGNDCAWRSQAFRSGDYAGSLAMWIRSNTVGDWFFTVGDLDVNPYFQCGIRGTGTPEIRFSVGPNEVNADCGSIVGGWHHVVYRSSGTSWDFVVDGIPCAAVVTLGSNTGQWFGDLASNARGAISGYWSTLGVGTLHNPFAGFMGEVAYSNTRWSDDVCREIYNGTRGLYI